MRQMWKALQSLSRDRRGATAVEYGFILALIVIAIIAALTEFGATTTQMWNNVSMRVQSASG